MFFLQKKYAGWITAVFATFVLVTQRWYMNFARFAFETTFLLFLELMATLTIFRYRETKKMYYLVMSGVFTGLAFNSYTPGRIFVLLPLFILLSEINIKKLTWEMVKPTVMFLVSFGLIILPLGLYLSQNSDTRVYQQFFITNENLTIPTRILYLGQNILNNFTMLFWKGDISAIHNYPYKSALNPIIGMFFLGGFVLSIWNWKNLYNRYFLLYFLLSLIPTWLTYPWENPNMLRTFTTLPAIAYFVGQAILWIVEKVKYKKLVIGIILLVLIVSAIYELRTYFMFQSEVFKTIFTSSLDFEFFRQQD